MHTPNKPNLRKTNPTQKAPSTAHCRQSVKQTTQRAEKVVEHTVPNKNEVERWTLCAQRGKRQRTHGKSSEKRAMKRKCDGREIGRATRNATETGQTRIWASSSRKNGKKACGKLSEKRARQRNAVVGKEWEGNEFGSNYVSRPQQKNKPNNLAVPPEQT